MHHILFTMCIFLNVDHFLVTSVECKACPITQEAMESESFSVFQLHLECVQGLHLGLFAPSVLIIYPITSQAFHWIWQSIPVQD